MVNDPFKPFERWLSWMDSHDGRIKRCITNKGCESDLDIACLLPAGEWQSIVTVGDIRALVEAGKELKRLRTKHSVSETQSRED